MLDQMTAHLNFKQCISPCYLLYCMYSMLSSLSAASVVGQECSVCVLPTELYQQ